LQKCFSIILIFREMNKYGYFILLGRAALTSRQRTIPDSGTGGKETSALDLGGKKYDSTICKRISIYLLIPATAFARKSWKALFS